MTASSKDKRLEGVGVMAGSLTALALIPGVNGLALGAIALAGLVRMVQGTNNGDS